MVPASRHHHPRDGSPWQPQAPPRGEVRRGDRGTARTRWLPASSAQTAPGRQGSGPPKALTTRETPLGILRGPWAFSAVTGRGPLCSLSVDSRSRPPWRAENSSTVPGVIRSVWAPPGLSVGRRRRLEGAHTLTHVPSKSLVLGF